MKLPKDLSSTENHLLAEDCLVDILLLSRCEFLVHGLSGVSEAAILYSPNLGLHFASLDLSRDIDSQWGWLETRRARGRARRGG